MATGKVNWNDLGGDAWNRQISRVVDTAIENLQDAATAAVQDEARKLRRVTKTERLGNDDGPPPMPRHLRTRSNRATEHTAEGVPTSVDGIFDQTEPDTPRELDDADDVSASDALRSMLFTPNPSAGYTPEMCSEEAIAYWRQFCPVQDADFDDEIEDDEESDDGEQEPEGDDDEAGYDEDDDEDDDDAVEAAWFVAWNARTGEAFCGYGDDLDKHIVQLRQDPNDWDVEDDPDELMAMPYSKAALRRVLDRIDSMDMDPAVESYIASHRNQQPTVLQHVVVPGVSAPLSLFGVIRGVQYDADKEGRRVERFSHTHGERTKAFPSLYKIHDPETGKPSEHAALMFNPVGLFDAEGKWLDD